MPPRIRNVHHNDIICTKGNRTFQSHEGNINYDSLIRQYAPQYGACASKQEKKTITQQIISILQDGDARFLKPIYIPRTSTIDHYVRLTNRKIHERVSHALQVRWKQLLVLHAEQQQQQIQQQATTATTTQPLPTTVANNPNIISPSFLNRDIPNNPTYELSTNVPTTPSRPNNRDVVNVNDVIDNDDDDYHIVQNIFDDDEIRTRERSSSVELILENALHTDHEVEIQNYPTAFALLAIAEPIITSSSVRHRPPTPQQVQPEPEPEPEPQQRRITYQVNYHRWNYVTEIRATPDVVPSAAAITPAVVPSSANRRRRQRRSSQNQSNNSNNNNGNNNNNNNNNNDNNRNNRNRNNNNNSNNHQNNNNNDNTSTFDVKEWKRQQYWRRQRLKRKKLKQQQQRDQEEQMNNNTYNSNNSNNNRNNDRNDNNSNTNHNSDKPFDVKEWKRQQYWRRQRLKRKKLKQQQRQQEEEEEEQERQRQLQQQLLRRYADSSDDDDDSYVLVL